MGGDVLLLRGSTLFVREGLQRNSYFCLGGLGVLNLHMSERHAGKDCVDGCLDTTGFLRASKIERLCSEVQTFPRRNRLGVCLSLFSAYLQEEAPDCHSVGLRMELSGAGKNRCAPQLGIPKRSKRNRAT